MAELVLTTAVKAGVAALQSAAAVAIGRLFEPDREVGRLAAVQIQSSTEGAGLPIVYGRARLAGQVIWAARFKETNATDGAGGKGGPTITEYAYTASFAVALCEGEIDGIGRIWADGAAFRPSDVTMRVYTGTEDQLPDPLVEATEGAGVVPAFRGVAYVVFEDLPLGPYGNRIPQLNFEVFRAPRAPGAESLETLARAVTLIPGSGEFAYATSVVKRDLGPGREQAENVNNVRSQTDIAAALDDLQARLPNCTRVMLVVSWFGDDVRCGDCAIRPGVENREKVTQPYVWRVGGEERDVAYLVSQSNGEPNYGGTPADQSVLEAIAELKARGLKVGLLPFILMDVPPGNAKPDPYGGSEQAAFPWRGRITCHPAPGQPASPDQTAPAGAQVAAFFGTAAAADFTASAGAVAYAGPAEWSFRRFVLHHAHLAALAGGVDTFVIGSEMRGLTQVRDGPGSYPAVAALQTLATDTRAVLGPGATITYAADWSEYFGHQPTDGSGDVYFHLDPLWAHAEIDAVGIDWYAPMADWRDGADHLDAQSHRSIYEPAYLQSNIEGGEGFDWYYASQADRDAQTRTSITDGAGKPWVFRYKDLRSWWSQPHHDRPGGVESQTPTAWVPQSKPIVFIEAGVPAVDKGVNQPNVFVDPKSAESALPRYSDGARDDFVQRRALEALLTYWRPETGNNPVSSVYGGPMIAWDETHLWTWDARPFPDFPARVEVWSDGPNWSVGHWLTGRAGLAPLGDVASDLALRAGMGPADASELYGVVAGYLIDRPVSARAALEPLARVHRFTAAPRAGALAFVASDLETDAALDVAELVLSDAATRLERRRADAADHPIQARVRFLDETREYRAAAALARRDGADDRPVLDLSAPMVLDHADAERVARALLADAASAVETVALAVPPSRLAVEAGDVVTVAGAGAAGPYRVREVEEGAARRLLLEALADGPVGLIAGPAAGVGQDVDAGASTPFGVVLDLPLLAEETTDRGGPLAAAAAEPWPGDVRVGAGTDLATVRERAQLPAAAIVGELLGDLPAGPEGRWDDASRVRVRVWGGSLASRAAADVLAGANRVAIRNGAGAWEIAHFQNATLVEASTFELTGLLRAIGGTEGAMGASAGAQIVVLDDRTRAAPLADFERGADLAWRFAPPGIAFADAGAAALTARYDGADLRPLSPVGLRAARENGDIALAWIRRSRIGADDWAAAEIPLGETVERYRVEVLDAGVPVWTRETDTPSAMFTAAEEAALFPAAPLASITVRLAQFSQVVGWGAPRTATLGV